MGKGYKIPKAESQVVPVFRCSSGIKSQGFRTPPSSSSCNPPPLSKGIPRHKVLSAGKMKSASGLLPFPGVEHHLPQLANICFAALGMSDLDCSEQAPLCHAVLPLHPPLWHCSLQSAVHLGHGPGGRAANQSWIHALRTTGIGTTTVPLPVPRSQGRNR